MRLPRRRNASCSPSQGYLVYANASSMKPFLSSLAALFFTTAFLHGDLVIVQKVEGAGQSGEQTIKIQGDKARTDLAQPVSIIMDFATGDLITLMHAQRSYSKVSATQAKAMIEQVKKLSGNTPPPKLQTTGKHEKIGEYDCEIFTANLGFLTVTYWIAHSYPNYQGMLAQMAKVQSGGISAMANGLMPDMKDFPGLPIKTEMNLGGAKIINIIVSAKEEAVDPAIFKIPNGYKEVSAPDLDLQLVK
jgi:hypothetical protein